MKLPVDVPAATGRPFIALAQEVAAGILRIIEEGWGRALAPTHIGTDNGELEITERLRDGMREAANARALELSLVVLPGSESRSRPDVATPDGRTDIPLLIIEIFLRYGEHDPHAIIECKRVAGSRPDLCREYVVEGIDRFRHGKYSANHSIGFMIGYLVAGDANSAASRINRYLKGKSRDADSLHRSNLVAASWARRSAHARSSGSSIELHHAFLAFTAPRLGRRVRPDS